MIIEKKRIVLLLPNLHEGGMERVMSELANYFAKKPYLDVHLVLYGINRKIFYPVSSAVSLHQPPASISKGIKLLNISKTAFYLRKKIKELRPNAVLSFGEYWNSFVLLSLSGLKTNIYVSDRCQPSKNLGLIQELLRKWLYRYAKGIIAQTEEAANIYKTKLNHPCIRVISNPIRNVACKAEINREKVVLSVGRLIKTKHHDELIKLFCDIVTPGWKLVIVGHDIRNQQNFKRLSKLIADLNAVDQVILVGSQQDVDAYYCSSSLFAFTSSSEGFPNVLGEAQMAGLPIVCFDCKSGPAEMVIDNVNGFLVPVFDFDLFKKKLQLLMNQENLRREFGDAAKRSVQKFSLETQGLAFEEILLK